MEMEKKLKDFSILEYIDCQKREREKYLRELERIRKLKEKFQRAFTVYYATEIV